MSPVHEGGGRLLFDSVTGKLFRDPTTGKLVRKITTDGSTRLKCSFRMWNPRAATVFKSGYDVSISEVGYWPGDQFVVGSADAAPFNDYYGGTFGERLSHIQFYGDNPADSFAAGSANCVRGALPTLYLYVGYAGTVGVVSGGAFTQERFIYTFGILPSLIISTGEEIILRPGGRLSITANMQSLP